MKIHRREERYDAEQIKSLSLQQRLLFYRGIDPRIGVDYGLKQLLPPDGLAHIDEAAELLAEAVQAQAKIVIVGDFDADGATSCALAIRCLRAFGLESVDYLVPNRFEFGYGLSPEIVGVAATMQPDIIITVDNGISSIDGVHAAQALGIMVLVTDHHLPAEELPTADVIVNPNLPHDKFTSKNLAGVGVIFYVMLGLRKKLRQLNWFKGNNIAEPNMSQYLDLVALGTVADVVPLDENNRILVQQGLQRIRSGRGSVGIEALALVAKRDHRYLTSSDLGFALGPRINAAGRLEDMSVGIECLLSDDSSHCHRLALQLDALNQERKQVQETMQEDARAIVSKLEISQDSIPPLVVLHDESWHQGVVGLVASRIKEQLHRPVIALAPAEQSGSWKGSGRSIKGLHMRDLLARLDAVEPGIMQKFGGHAMAAGLSLSNEKLAAFKHAITAVAEQFMRGVSLQQKIVSDGNLSTEDYEVDAVSELMQAHPWGQQFEPPLFDDTFWIRDARNIHNKHLKLKVQPVDTDIVLEAIYFNYFDQNAEKPWGECQLVFRPDINRYQGRESVQLIVQQLATGSETSC